MWFNVWFIIWPAQQIVMASAAQVATGGAAIPEAAARGTRAGLASRTNTLLSIPMLFFMGAASHLQALGMPRSGVVFWVGAAIIMLLVEINCLKGTPGKGAAKPLATVSGTLWAGFILTAIFYIWFEVMRG